MGRQRLVQLLIVLLAGFWSIAMGVLGLWLIAEPHTGLLGHKPVSISAGTCALCAAQLIFIDCVAIRLFPNPHPTMWLLTRSTNVVILGASMCVLLIAAMGAGV